MLRVVKMWARCGCLAGKFGGSSRGPEAKKIGTDGTVSQQKSSLPRVL